MPRLTDSPLPAVLILCVLGALNACKDTTSAPEPADTVAGSVYQLRDGRFIPAPGEGTSATPLQPWTVQERVADLAAIGDRVFLGVNGRGIAVLTVPAQGEPDFTYFYDPLLFRYRTLTTLIPESAAGEDSLLCHLYFNRLLNVVSQRELKLQGISLLRLIPSSGEYSFLTPPYQEQHPEWEAVGFVPVTPREFFLQWKYSDRNRTLFSHSRLELAGLTETEVEPLAYRQSYGFEDVLQTAVLKDLLAEARSRLDTPGVSTAYQLQIRYPDQPLVRRYEYHPADFASAREIRLFSLSGLASGGSYLLLLPDGLLLQATSENRQIRRLQLAALPPDHVYTHLLTHEGKLIACWEQTAFTDVGAAGIFFAVFPYIR